MRLLSIAITLLMASYLSLSLAYSTLGDLESQPKLYSGLRLESDDGEPLVPGINISFSATFWNNLLKGLLPEIFKKLKQTVFETGSTTIDLKGLMTIFMTVNHFEITALSYDTQRTRVDLNSDNNTIGVYVKNGTFAIDLSYDLDLDPAIITDTGNMTMSFTNFTLDVLFQIGSESDVENIDVKVFHSDINLYPEALQIHLNNTNDFNQLILFIMHTTKAPIMNIVQRVFEEHLEQGINAGIHAIPNPINVGNMSLDISLTQRAKIEQDRSVNLLVGKFFPTNEGGVPFVNTNVIPRWQDTGKSLQLYISEFTLQSLFYTQYQLGNLQGIIDKSPSETLLAFTVDSFSYFIPDMLKIYKKGQKTRLRLNATDTYPHVTLLKDHVIVNGTFLLALDVEISEGVWDQALLAAVSASFDGNIMIYGDLRLKASITSVQLSLNRYVEAKVKVNEQMLHLLVSIIETTLKLSVNTLFLAGISLKNFLPFPIDLGEVAFSMQKGYLTLQATPEFTSAANIKNLDEIIDKYIFGERSLLGSNQELKQTLKKSFLEVVKKTNFKQLFGRHKVVGVKSAYKGYKFFESVFNLPNPDFEHEDFSDL